MTFKILPYQDKLAPPLRSQSTLGLLNTKKCPCSDLVQNESVQNSGGYQQSKEKKHPQGHIQLDIATSCEDIKVCNTQIRDLQPI